jgi:hypothetical protein
MHDSDVRLTRQNPCEAFANDANLRDDDDPE